MERHQRPPISDPQPLPNLLPVLRPPGTATQFIPSPPSTSTMLTLLISTNSILEDPIKRPKPNPLPKNFKPVTTSLLEYIEKFRRLMKNREFAARSRAKKQVSYSVLDFSLSTVFLSSG
ncbi:hypothetical protein L2E82_14280 [Cichorium intybus]|uniref:Uncharacterized protein n=1 Tax=Cichorium intybus TaxID=13427 RepID=A0ACB9EYV5_CICIN|nr:hypothetical protein L2E82_14280 [Cichorium intybus]